MKRSTLVLVLLMICTVVSAPAALAQETGFSHKNGVDFVRGGYFYGRSGIANGSTGYLEINPSRWIGFFGFASHSQNAFDQDGGRATAWDFMYGAGITARAPELKGFLVSPFAQFANQSEHDMFVLPLGDGTFEQDEESSRRHVFTVGVSVDRAIVRNGPRWAVRIGRNLGDGPAAKNAGGLYLMGGVIFPLNHPVELGRSFKRMVGMKPQATKSAAAQP